MEEKEAKLTLIAAIAGAAIIMIIYIFTGFLSYCLASPFGYVLFLIPFAVYGEAMTLIIVKSNREREKIEKKKIILPVAEMIVGSILLLIGACFWKMLTIPGLTIPELAIAGIVIPGLLVGLPFLSSGFVVFIKGIESFPRRQ